MLNGDRHVAHQPAEIIRQPVQRHDDHFLEPARFNVDHPPIVGASVGIDANRGGHGPEAAAGAWSTCDIRPSAWDVRLCPAGGPASIVVT